MNKGIKRDLGFFIGPIGSAVVGFITTPIITFFITPEEYANVNMYQMVQSILSVVIYLGFDQAYVRYFNDEIDKEKLWINAAIIPLVLATVLALLIGGNSNLFANYILGSNERLFPIFFMCVSIPLMVCERFILLSYRMRERAFFYSLANILLKCLVLAMTVFFFVFLEKSFYSAIYGSVLGQGIYDVGLIIVSKLGTGKVRIKEFSLSQVKCLAKYALPLAPIGAIHMMLNSADRVAIKKFSTLTELGLYGVALKITGIIGILKTCFTTFWTPLAFRWHSEKKDKEMYVAVIELVTGIMMIICFLTYLVKPIIFMIFGTAYSGAQNIFPFLMFYPILYTIEEAFVVGILFNNKGKHITRMSVVILLLDLMLNYVFVPKWGAIGAAMATATVNLIYFFGLMFFSRKIWFKFPCIKIVWAVITLFITSLINTFGKSNVVYIFNLIAIGLMCILFYKRFFECLSLLKHVQSRNDS